MRLLFCFLLALLAWGSILELGSKSGFSSGGPFAGTITAVGNSLGSVDASCDQVKWLSVNYFVMNTAGGMDNISFALYDSTTPGSTPLISINEQGVSSGGWETIALVDTMSTAPSGTLYGFAGRPAGTTPTFRRKTGTGRQSTVASHDVAVDMPTTTANSFEIALMFEYLCCEFGANGSSCLDCTDYGNALCSGDSICCDGDIHECSGGYVQATVLVDCDAGCDPATTTCTCGDCAYGCFENTRCYAQCEVGADCAGQPAAFCCDTLLLGACENSSVSGNTPCTTPTPFCDANSNECTTQPRGVDVPAIVGGVVGGLTIVAVIIALIVGVVVAVVVRTRVTSSSGGGGGVKPNAVSLEETTKKTARPVAESQAKTNKKKEDEGHSSSTSSSSDGD